LPVLDMAGDKLIYIQIAEWLENEILGGNIEAHEKIYSQYQLAEMFNINPATAARGINILVDQGVLYKKRGLGMFLKADAQEKIQHKRRHHTLKRLVRKVVIEARRLGITEGELAQIIGQVGKELDK